MTPLVKAGCIFATAVALNYALHSGALPAVPHLGMAADPRPVQVSGSVDSWITAAGVLDRRRWTASQRDDLRIIAEHESGGQADAVNNWDSNAAAGHPTKGVDQMRDDTYAAWAPPGCQEARLIFNPPCNIASAARYAEGRYGSLDNVPGVVAVRNGRPYVGY